MSYSIKIVPRAQKNFESIPSPFFDNITNEINLLVNDPRPFGMKKLKGRDGYRIRIGKYRVIYIVDESKKEITILDVNHRKDIYR